MNPKNLMEEMKENLPSHISVEIPPKIFKEIEGSILEYVEGKSLKTSFPVFEKYAGPTGMMQGGIITAAFDNTFGPLSYMVAKTPCISLHINTSYVRPVPCGAESITVHVVIKEKTKKFLFMDGEARNSQGKLVATATTQMMIV